MSEKTKAILVCLIIMLVSVGAGAFFHHFCKDTMPSRPYKEVKEETKAVKQLGH